SLASRLIALYLRATRANRKYLSPDEARKHIERSRIRPRPYGPPRRLRPDVSLSVDHAQGCPVYTLKPRAGASRGGVVYIHGGGWVNEIARQHWHLVARIAADARTSVTVPIYPLVPFGTAEQVVSTVAEIVLVSNDRHGGT